MFKRFTWEWYEDGNWSFGIAYMTAPHHFAIHLYKRAFVINLK